MDIKEAIARLVNKVDLSEGETVEVMNQIMGGEATPWELVEKIQQSGGCRIVNHYGPTETTIGVTTYPVPRERLAAFAARPVIGRPIGNVTAYVASPSLQLLPVGAAGELLLGSVQQIVTVTISSEINVLVVGVLLVLFVVLAPDGVLGLFRKLVRRK